MNHQITCTVNDQSYQVSVASQQTLLQMLREQLELTGAKTGCATGECGACSVLLNDEVVNACLVLAVEVDQASIVTVEGLAENGELSTLQQSFLDHSASQCGFCTSGMLIAACALLKQASRPEASAIRAGLGGNLCRCTGYEDIVKAIMAASRARRT